jgi:hypothetical protein
MTGLPVLGDRWTLADAVFTVNRGLCACTQAGLSVSKATTATT